MKKIMAYNKIKKLFNLLLVVCLILFNSLFTLSCGLEIFYFVNPPVCANNEPTINSNIIQRTFHFDTKESIDSANGFKFLGTEIYYKIYIDQKHMDSEVSGIRTAIGNDEKNNTTTSADRLIQDGGSGYGYSQLSMKSNGRLVPINISRDELCSVQFRLTNAGLGEQYDRHIKVNGVDIESGYEGPLRANGGSFDFTKVENRPDTIDVTKDKDTYKEGYLSQDHKYYVAIFAVSKGLNVQGANIYSRATYLGEVLINGKENFN